jgi:hypothetical protein
MWAHGGDDGTCRLSGSSKVMPIQPSVRIISLQRADRCKTCGTDLAIGDRAGWDQKTNATTCLGCLPGDDLPLDRGQAGASVDRTYQRRAERHHRTEQERVSADRERRQKIKSEHPIFGRVATGLTPKAQARPEPAHVRSWGIGAPGERRVGEVLDSIEGTVALHDRRIPGRRGNIDHIAVTPSAVWVIDAKRYVDKRVDYHDAGGWLRTDERLRVGGRDETELVEAMTAQVQAVTAVLAAAGIDAAVKPLLCFVASTWSWFAKPFMVRGVAIAWPLALPEILARPGPNDDEPIQRVARVLAAALPPA